MSALSRALSGVAVSLLIGFLWSGAAPPTRAEPPKGPDQAPPEKIQPLDWLRGQPLTLFDWGLFNLRRDLDRVALWVADSGLSDEKPLTGTQHDWRRGRITAYLSFAAPPKKRSRKYCHMVFTRAAAQLMKGAPQGVGQASWYLSSVFLPRGRGWIRPSRDFSENLVKTVRLEIVLRPAPEEFHPGGPRVRCVGRLDATKGTELTDEVTH